VYVKSKLAHASSESKIITICIPIVDRAECVEAFLPRSVPDGKIDGGGIDVQALAQERRWATRNVRRRAEAEAGA
jgi:hypothetical protein